MPKLPDPFNDALKQALSPRVRKMRAPETEDDEAEPGYAHRYQGPPAVQRQGVAQDA